MTRYREMRPKDFHRANSVIVDHPDGGVLHDIYRITANQSLYDSISTHTILTIKTTLA